MSELLSGLLAGGWPFLVGSVFPAAIALALEQAVAASTGHGSSLTASAATVVAGAVALGLLLSALQVPMYRFLEGYYLKEPRAGTWAHSQRVRRDQLRDELLARRRGFSNSMAGIKRGLLVEQLRRYPSEDDQVAPTRFANHLRALERYGRDRFCLDSQTLWNELINVVPGTLRDDEQHARAGVDFFVALIYLGLVGGTAAGVAVILDPTHWIVFGSVAAGALASTWLWYELAVISVSPWYLAVQAIVNLGRVPLAAKLGLVLPASLEEERQMWRTVGWLVREPYNPRISELLEPYRATPPDPRASATEP